MQSGFHRIGIRIVTVVEHGDTAHIEAGQTAGGQFGRSESRRAFAQGQSEFEPGGNRQQRIAHHVVAGHRQMGRHFFTGVNQFEVETVRGGTHFLRTQTIGRPGENNARFGPCGQRGCELIPLRKDQHRVGRQGLAKHSFFLRDGLARSEEFDVCHADVGNDADIRAGEAGERFDFTGVVHADFPDANLIDAFGRENGQGKTDMVVQVAFGFVHRKTRAGDRSGKVFGARFSIATREANHAGGKFVAIPVRQTDQCGLRIIDANEREIRGHIGNLARHHGTRGTGRRGGGDELVTVEIFTRKDPVEIARLQRARVFANVRHGNGAVPAEQNSAAGCGQSMESGRVHDQAAFSRMADAASATSSNGTLRSANS